MITRGEHVEIRNLLENGLSKSEAARQLGVSRATIRKYAATPDYQPYDRKDLPKSKLEPFRDFIRARLDKYPLSAVRIFDEITKMGYGGRMTILRDFMKSVRHQKNYHAVMRFETEPGQQAQIDWGFFGLIRMPDGKMKRLYGFCMVLGYSRIRCLEFTTSMKLENLIRCHINAFEYCGGAANEHLYDNMKQVVLYRGRTAEESDMQPLFADFAAHYGTKVKLCRVRKPRTKGKVENLVNYAKDNFFLGLEFCGLEDLNGKARAWMDKINGQVHSTTKEIPFDRLKRELPLLIQTKGKPEFRISQVLYRKARCNCLVSLFSSEYSVPPKFANREVEVRVDEKEVRIFYKGQEIACHARQEAGVVSFIDAHKRELEENCFYFPKQIKHRREAAQLPRAEQPVEIRSLDSYEVEQ